MEGGSRAARAIEDQAEKAAGRGPEAALTRCRPAAISPLVSRPAAISPLVSLPGSPVVPRAGSSLVMIGMST